MYTRDGWEIVHVSPEGVYIVGPDGTTLLVTQVGTFIVDDWEG